MGIRDDKERIAARTSGAVLRVTVRIPRKGLTQLTHIWAMFGGMGGKDDITGSRCGDGAHRMEELPDLRRRAYQAEIDSQQSETFIKDGAEDDSAQCA